MVCLFLRSLGRTRVHYGDSSSCAAGFSESVKLDISTASAGSIRVLSARGIRRRPLHRTPSVSVCNIAREPFGSTKKRRRRESRGKLTNPRRSRIKVEAESRRSLAENEVYILAAHVD